MTGSAPHEAERTAVREIIRQELGVASSKVAGGEIAA